MSRFLLCWLAVPAASVFLLSGAEYHSVVRANGLPVPGVTITAKQGDTTLVTTSGEQGEFSFPEIGDGQWSFEFKMTGFETISRTVVLPAAMPSAWELKILSRERILSTLKRATADSKTAAAAAVPASAAPAPRPASRQTANNVRGGPGFQRLNVNQAAEAPAFEADTGLRTEDVADLSQSAANSFIVQGSLSSALGMPQQNDWGFGPFPMAMGGMHGPQMMGMGGPPGMNPDGGGLATNEPMGAQVGPRGPGGPGGFAGRPGGPAGGPGGFAGRPGGPGGGPPGGLRGRGGVAGPVIRHDGPGRPDWQARRNSMAFGNNRRNPRNQYNGMGMFSLNDSIWDARSFSVTGARVDKPDYSNARGGVMIVGPLRIPKLVSADKEILFTFNLHFSRDRTGTVSDPVTMPTPLERAGDFSRTRVGGVPVAIFDPATGAPFPGNVIPASRISPQAPSLLSFFPEPNLPFEIRNYQTSWTGSSNSYNIGSRLSNIRIGSKDRLNGNFAYQGSNHTTPNLLAFTDTGSGRGINTGLMWSRNITAALINNVQFSFSRMRQQMLPFFSYSRNVAAELGIAGVSQQPANWGPPELRFTNYPSLTDANFSLNRNQTVSVGESLLIVHGQHNVRVGGNLRRMQINQLADSNGRGTWTFNGLMTAAPGLPSTGYDLADFLLGMPTTASIRHGNPDKYFRSSGYEVYVNDDWRIHPAFSLNFGLRWDYTTPISEKYGRLVNLAIGPSFTTAAPVIAARIHPDHNNFSPRLGFAWRPQANRSTVVRGGYGVYYNTSVYNVIASNMAQQPPFAQVVNASTSAADPLTFSRGFLLPANPLASSTYAIDPYYRIGYAQTWTVSVQHDLPFSMFGSAGYLGTKGTRLDQQFLPNTAPPGEPPLALPRGFIYEMSNGNSIYHAAQFQLNRRFRSGLGANLSYQFSKSIDNAGTGGRGQGGTPVAQNWLDYSAERGLSSFDSRHNLSLAAQYSTAMGRPGGTLVSGWKGALLKDWTVSSMLTLRSGNPFTAGVGGSQSQVRGTAVGNTVRADATGLPIDAPGMLFNTAAFSLPPPGEWGTAGRNTIPGPTVLFLSGGIGRVFRLGERRSVNVQLQSQNVLNRVVITNWGTIVGANNFGLATAAAPMRTLTLNLRFRF